MLSIGVFASIGQVSVRMLRHWDTVGLLRPCHVEEWTGYRSYSADQLDRLNRIVALRDLGFGLAEVGTLLEGGLTAPELTEMLRHRGEQVEREHRQAVARLADVRHRLHLIAEEKTMTEIVIRTLPAVRLAACRGWLAERPDTEGVVEALFDRAQRAVEAVGGSLANPIAEYTATEDGTEVVAGFEQAQPVPGTEVVDLVEVERAACTVHLGEMSRVGDSWQATHRDLEARALVPEARCRERYVRAEGSDQSDWVVELQQPLRPDQGQRVGPAGVSAAAGRRPRPHR